MDSGDGEGTAIEGANSFQIKRVMEESKNNTNNMETIPDNYSIKTVEMAEEAEQEKRKLVQCISQIGGQNISSFSCLGVAGTEA